MSLTVEFSSITSREYYAWILWIAKGLICGDCVGNDASVDTKAAMVIILNLRFRSRHGMNTGVSKLLHL
jgi:hypothetical protein